MHSEPAASTSAAVIHSSVLESQNELSYAQFMVSDVRDLQAPKLQPLSGVGEVTVADWQTAVAVDLGSWPAAGAASARASSRRSIVGRGLVFLFSALVGERQRRSFCMVARSALPPRDVILKVMVYTSDIPLYLRTVYRYQEISVAITEHLLSLYDLGTRRVDQGETRSRDSDSQSAGLGQWVRQYYQCSVTK